MGGWGVSGTENNVLTLLNILFKQKKIFKKIMMEDFPDLEAY